MSHFPLPPWPDQPGRTILGSNAYRPGVRCDGPVTPEEVTAIKDYNIGVPGFLAVRGGDHLEALYYCGGDAYEREGWCYAQRIQLGWMVATEAGYCPSGQLVPGFARSMLPLR